MGLGESGHLYWKASFIKVSVRLFAVPCLKKIKFFLVLNGGALLCSSAFG